MGAQQSLLGFDAHLILDDDGESGSVTSRITCDEEATNKSGHSCSVNIKYITEGAANVIWSFTPIGKADAVPERIRPWIQDRLLRLRKGDKATQCKEPGQKPPPFIPSVEIYGHISTKIAPLFDADQLVQHENILIDDSIIVQCNSVLDELERSGARSAKRRGWHIEQGETSGLLVQSMYPATKNTILFHIKPKWLLQSPTAPAGARRCRQCALLARREASTAHSLCPLALSAGDEQSVKSQLEKLALSDILIKAPDLLNPRHRRRLSLAPRERKLEQNFSEDDFQDIVPNLISVFARGGKAFAIFERLQSLQQRYDSQGVLNLLQLPPDGDEKGTELSVRPDVTKEDLNNLAMAMTLRDTTMFVKLTLNGQAIEDVDVRLADLDLKSGDDIQKLTQWWKTENNLIEEGWYTGTESLAPDKKIHTTCMLWNRQADCEQVP